MPYQLNIVFYTSDKECKIQDYYYWVTCCVCQCNFACSIKFCSLQISISIIHIIMLKYVNGKFFLTHYSNVKTCNLLIKYLLLYYTKRKLLNTIIYYVLKLYQSNISHPCWDIILWWYFVTPNTACLSKEANNESSFWIGTVVFEIIERKQSKWVPADKLYLLMIIIKLYL